MDGIYRVLVLCTGNSARSIMAEALINTLGKGCFQAYSAGSHPAGHVHPYAIELVASVGYRCDQLRSKSWEEFVQPDAPLMDFIITVCDNAAGEICPVWPGQPISAHWGFEDPTLAGGSDADKRRVFASVFRGIANRVRLLLDIPLASLDRAAIQHEIKAIGNTPV